MKIALIGPGILPIPPLGWGAVEMLIWDYKQALEKLGHQVQIINSTNFSNVFDQCSEFAPEVIHIQYDDYIDWVQNLKKITQSIFITSHYGYIHNQRRYEPNYCQIFEKFIKENVKIIALSDKAAQIYIANGKSKNDVFVVHNGANLEKFKFNSENKNDAPKSIYLAKITSRKRQNLLYGIDNIFYAGNFDHSIPLPPENYLGEIHKEELYETLCNYDNLILLSDGEAHPLVVCEALAAGLGVVVSEYACENLDTSLPFVTVIPESKINDKFYLENRIQNNAFISREMKPEIRKYAEQKFNWDKIVLNYLEVIKK